MYLGYKAVSISARYGRWALHPLFRPICGLSGALRQLRLICHSCLARHACPGAVWLYPSTNARCTHVLDCQIRCRCVPLLDCSRRVGYLVAKSLETNLKLKHCMIAPFRIRCWRPALWDSLPMSTRVWGSDALHNHWPLWLQCFPISTQQDSSLILRSVRVLLTIPSHYLRQQVRPAYRQFNCLCGVMPLSQPM